MHRAGSKAFIVAFVLSGAVFAQSQPGESLGDVARANRAKEQAPASPKVITNQDLPSDASDVPEKDSSAQKTKTSGLKKADHSADQRLSNRVLAEQRITEQWKARIEDQENRIADLQARIDHVNASIRAAVGTAQYDTPASRTHAIEMERLAKLQQKLAEEKRKLEQMQDAARRAGAGQ
jgi:predicted RNase H-like nuclease (RuvC/YqgF family)